MKCKECRQQIAGGTKYCPLCGAPLPRQRAVPAAVIARTGTAAIPPASLVGPTGWQDSLPGRASRSARFRRGIAIAACGVIALTGAVITIGLRATNSAAHQLTWSELRVADCLTGSNMHLSGGGTWPELVTAVPCSRPHPAEVFFAGRGWPKAAAPYPGLAKIGTQAAQRCDDAFRGYVTSPDYIAEFTYTDIVPSRSSWSAGDRRLVCVAYEADGARIASSIRGGHR